MLARLRTLLSVSEGTADDARLSFALDAATEAVLNYCNLTELPEGLTLAVMRITMDVWRAEKGEKAVRSVTMGDASVAYAEANYNILTGAGGAEFINNYSKQLNCYRKLRVMHNV